MSASKRNSKRRMDDICYEEQPEPDTPSKTRVGRKVKARSAGISNVTSESRQRKSQRKVMCEKKMTRLNHSFAQWAHEAETLLSEYYTARASTTTTPPPLKAVDFSLLPAVRKYIKAAEKISHDYQPRTFQLLTFGSGDCGQLALSEDVFESRTPKMVKGIQERVTSIACGGLHTVVALENTGRVEIWGCNDHGSLGDCGVAGTGWLPLPVRGLIPSKEEVVRKDTLENAKKYWSDMSPLEQEALEDPRKSKSLPIDWEEPITMVAAGDCQTLMLSTTGRVYMCGCYKDKDGKMWRDEKPPDDPRVLHPTEKKRGEIAPEGTQDWPIHLHQMPGKVEAISCGASFNAAIVSIKRKGDGVLQRSCVTWGLGECGELARPVFKPLKKPDRDDPQFQVVMTKAREEYLKPQPVIWADQALTYRHDVQSIACGAFHLLVVASDGKNGVRQVYASGLNNYGQLGTGDLEPRQELTKVDALENSNIAMVAAGVHHSLCLDSSGENLYGFGRGDYGQMGITKKIPDVGFCKTLPVVINLSEGDEEISNITQISCGGNHCMVLTESGDAYTWGYGENNALGHGVEQDEYTPRKFDPMTGINKKRLKDGMVLLNGKIELIDGGGQHSAVSIRSSIA